MWEANESTRAALDDARSPASKRQKAGAVDGQADEGDAHSSLDDASKSGGGEDSTAEAEEPNAKGMAKAKAKSKAQAKANG